MTLSEAEERPTPKKRGRIRRSMPKMPWNRRNTGIGSSLHFAREAFSRKKATCPICGAGRLRVRDDINQSDGQILTPVLACDTCEHTESITLQLDKIADRIDEFRVGERRFLLAAFGTVGFGLLYYLLTGNIYTLIGVSLISVTLFANALVFRYRVWQITFGRLYEAKGAPLRDWLRYEFSSKSSDA